MAANETVMHMDKRKATMNDEDAKRELTEIIHGRFAAFKDDNVPGLESDLSDDATIWDVFTPQLIR